MGLLLNFVFFIFLLLFFIVCFTGWFFYHSFRNIADRLKGNGDGQRRKGQQRRTYKNDSDDEVVVDHRTSNEAKRKIFSAGDGEYVDFEDVK